jgi:hypothetical protein
MPKSLATLQKELGDYEHIRDNYDYYALNKLLPNKYKPETKSQIEAMLSKTKAEITKRNDAAEISAPGNLAKREQEGREAGISALNSSRLGQKLPEDVIRKVSEYGGRKRKTRKTRKTRVKRRKTRRA